ncbi:MAG: hypothetical protein H6Q72_4365 [Firmicutes bacterium]|nr:hypothetical protein [Bacillota bacterium]
MQTTINNIIVKYDEQLQPEELNMYVEDELKHWNEKYPSKEIAYISVNIEGDEVIIKTVERSPITRLRRISGYLSEIDRFNDAKQAELHDRVVHA